MKKTWNFLRFELKKNLWAFVVLTAVCTIPYVAQLSTMTMSYTYEDWATKEEMVRITSSQIGTVFVMLGALCYIIPILVYSFKTSKRGVDGYYSLPLKKEKLYLVKTVLGLLLVLVPYTVAFWGGFFTLLCREGNPYAMVWYVPAYFGSLLLGICLFGINAFLFTRANKAGDGVVFMLAYIPFFWMLYAYFVQVFDQPHYFYNNYETGLLTFGGLINFGDTISDRIMRYVNSQFSPLTFIVMPVLGAIGYFLLFFNLRYERAENAEQVSDSWYGYKTLIPLYTSLLLATNGGISSPLMLCTATVGAIIATIVYRGKFKFGVKWWAMIGGALLLGVALGLPLGLPL